MNKKLHVESPEESNQTDILCPIALAAAIFRDGATGSYNELCEDLWQWIFGCLHLSECLALQRISQSVQKTILSVVNSTSSVVVTRKNEEHVFKFCKKLRKIVTKPGARTFVLSHIVKNNPNLSSISIIRVAATSSSDMASLISRIQKTCTVLSEFTIRCVDNSSLMRDAMKELIEYRGPNLKHFDLQFFCSSMNLQGCVNLQSVALDLYGSIVLKSLKTLCLLGGILSSWELEHILPVIPNLTTIEFCNQTCGMKHIRELAQLYPNTMRVLRLGNCDVSCLKVLGQGDTFTGLRVLEFSLLIRDSVRYHMVADKDTLSYPLYIYDEIMENVRKMHHDCFIRNLMT